MTSFTNIYKNELKSKGVLSSLGSTALKRTRERLDPRNMLFGGSGMIAATGQKIFGKGYSAIPNNLGSKLATKTAEVSGIQSEAVSSLLTSSLKQESQLAIIAKNTMNNNAMARDMNVMRQNVMKLVTMGGGKASRGADMFFKDAKARENEYESKFKKGLPTTPTSVKEEKEKSKGILGIVLLALGTLGTIISKALEKMSDSLGGIIKGLGKTIIDGIVSALTGLGILKRLPLPTPGPGKTGPGKTGPGKTGPGKTGPGTPGPGTPGTPGKTGPTTGAPKPSAAAVAGGVLTRVAVPVAAIAAVVAGVKIHDADKKEYLDLAKKKRDEGLTSEEEARIRKLSTISFRAAATQILNYDPIRGKASEAKTPGEIAAMQKREALKIGGPKMPTPEQYATGLDEEIQMAREKLKKEEQAAKLTPNRPLVERGLTQLREKLQKLEQERNSKVNDYTQAQKSMDDGSYNQAETNRLSMYKSNTSPEKVSEITFKDLTREQQNAFLLKQRESEGFKPGSLTYDLNNPGAMLYASWQKKFGGELDTTNRGVGSVKGKFAKFPTLADGIEAQRALWLGTDGAPSGKNSFSNLPLDKAINKWVTGNKDSDVDVNMGAQGMKITGYKTALFDAIKMPAPSSGLALASASTASSDLNRASSAQPAPQVVVDARQTNNNVAGGKGATPQVASATNIDALELFFKFAM